MAFIYETTVDPDAKDNAHGATLDIVGYNKRVLEVGCATGYFTKALRDRGCDVVGIEMDAEAAAITEQWAERVVVGNLDAGTLWKELEGEQFDALTFGDVLEHLRDPLTTLRAATRLLKPSGIVVISVPNVAHGDIRMALLQGEFPYRETGLLDRTHIRFFTLSGLRDMIKEAGLVLVETRRVVMPLFQTELAIERRNIPQSTINAILEDPESESYQFVVKAVRDNGTRTLATLAERITDLTDRAHDEVVRTALLHQEMDAKLRNAEVKSHSVARESEQRHAFLTTAESQLQDARDRLRDAEVALQQAERESEELRRQVQAILSTKAFRLLAPFRKLYARLFRRPKIQS
jgi:2-polyprenyl-3-methyl-5-hydroxy-6-metoxy-1,4-benzoquinol methylase